MTIERYTKFLGETIWVQTVKPGLTPKEYKTQEGKVATVSIYTPNKVHIKQDGVDHVLNRLEVQSFEAIKLRSIVPGVSYEFRYVPKGQGVKDKLKKYMRRRFK